MKLYLYKIGTAIPVLTIEDVVSYTADQAVTVDGTVYGPFAADCELSATADCAGTLRAEWRAINPSGGVPWGPEGISLGDLKAARVTESKTALAEYLAAHPLTWIDGKQYSVTEEKQSLLMGNIAAHQLELQSDPAAEITWNATGEECVVWDYAQLCALAIAIKSYVKPLVAYQQAKEVEVMGCETAEAVWAVKVDYDAAKGEVTA